MSVGAACVLTGCGTRQLDSSKLVSTMRQVLEGQAGLHVRSVRCPDNIAVGKGIVTPCTATLTDGHTVKMSAVQKDSNGNVHVGPAEMVADQIQNFIVNALAQRGVKATATCPQHQPVVVGSTFVCTATDPQNRSAKVQITVSNAAAGFSTKIVG
ncbi:MAG TPA: DUF4333 domain-containing protein [Solirubrobacteraceae bacterium]